MGKAIAIFVLASLLLGSLASVARAGVAPGTSIDNQAGASYLSATGNTTSSNSNVVQVVTQAGAAQANLILTKAVSAPTASPGDQISFALAVANVGTGDAVPVTVAIDGTNVSKIVVRDVIPDNTKFASFVASGGSTPLYHLYGAAAQNYITPAPTDFSTIDAVAFALDTFPVGATATFKFSVTLNANATGTITNTAIVYFNNGNDIASNSNTVVVNANGPIPNIGFFTSGAFSRPAPVGSAGQPLYIQANAAACNVNPVAPDTVQIAVSAALTSDLETYTATETGPNTGIFQVLPAPPTRDASSNPVVQGDGIMEVLSGDTVTAVLKGCGSSSVNATLLIDPTAVIFDSHSNQPVSGARVTLLDVTGQGNGGNPGQPATVLMADGVTPAASTVTTASDGRFQFLYVLPSTYKFSISAPSFTYPSMIAIGQLPTGRVVDANASYGKNFVVNSAGSVRFDQPVDLAGTGLLLVEKSVAQPTARAGDFLDYTIQVKNTSAVVLNNVQVSDTMPRRFAYQLGTTRIKAALASDPAGGKGPNLVFTLTAISANSEIDITYRVQVGATAALGANPNFVSAVSGSTQSNPASATVLVLGGAFTTEGFVIGKVFADCNGNSKQDLDELGIPGVRVLLEDQTSAITDIRGKYSIYGVTPLTHILKIDPLTLPEGYDGEILNHRNAGDPNSMFVDMKNGQMFRADFATRCSAKLANEIAQRTKKQGKGFVEAEAGLGANFTYDTLRRGTVEAKAAPSAGIVGHIPSAEQTPTGASPAKTAGSPSTTSFQPPAAPSVPVDPGSTVASAKPETTKSENTPLSTPVDVAGQALKPLETPLPAIANESVHTTLDAMQVCSATATSIASFHNNGSINPALAPSLALTSVFFPTDYPTLANPKVGLVPSQQATLSELAVNFKNYAQHDTTAKLLVVGHSDARGSQQSNLGLSQRRADLTKDFLVSLGTPAEKIETSAESGSQLLSSDEVAILLSSDSGKTPDYMTRQLAATTFAYNRRVDINLEPAGKESARTYPHSSPDVYILWQPTAPSANAVLSADPNFASARAGAPKSNIASATPPALGGNFSRELSQRRADLTKDALVSFDPAAEKIEAQAEIKSQRLDSEEVAIQLSGESVGKHSERTRSQISPKSHILWQAPTPGTNAATGTNPNFVSATAGDSSADTVSSKATVLGGNVSFDGSLSGRAFADCSGNGTQDLGKPGIPESQVSSENRISATVEDKAAPMSDGVEHGSGAAVSPTEGSPILAADSSSSVNTRFAATPSAPSDPKSTPASADPEKTTSGSQPVTTAANPAEKPLQPLEALLPNLDPKLGFINVKDDQVMPYTQTPVQVKGPVGSVFKLYVNDMVVGDKQVGKKVVDSEHQVEAWEFIGVELKPGRNSLRLAQFDPWGNERGAALINLIAPKPLHKFRIDVPKQAESDGKTPVQVGVHLLDADDVPVMVPVEITIESTDGEWQVKDTDPRQPGIQVYVEGGLAILPLIPPSDSGTAKIRISSGSVHSETQLPFVPVLRPMIAAGVVDEILSFHNFSGNSISPVQANDGFEEELRALSISNANGTTQLQSHVGLSLKGKVLGSYLLTLAYDSDKSNERLFRDIQPDEFYPVYGDSSVRSYDAQSTSRAYLRVDKGQSYVLYGDFATTENDPTRVLTVYNRSLTGTREHYENDRVNVTAFASHDTYSQHVQEIPANGTSGPYILSSTTGVINGETVQILVRDRNQPAVILKVTPETRFVDYEFEPYSGEILFTSPIPSLDQNLNPVSIRVTYEMDQGGERFWVAGVNGSVKLDERVRVGGTYVADLNPGDQFFMKGFNSSIKLDSHTTLNGEFAMTHQDTVGDGDGYHFEVLHESENVKARAYFGRTTATFDNINSLLNQGRGEGGLKLSWKFTPTTRLVADVIRTENTAAGGTQEGALVGIEHTLKNKMQLELGLRHVEQGNLAASPSTEGSTNTTTTSIRAKLIVPVPHVPKLQAYGEYEQDVHDFDKKIAAVGGTFQMFERAKIYARHELISSLGNQFALNSSQQQQATVVGIDSDSLKNTHVFSEYRDRDDFSGRETEAAIGLRRTWAVRPGLKLNGGVESVKVLKGVDATNNLALTSGVDFTSNSRFKGTSRLEWRASSNTRGYLSTLGAALKISQNWTFLGRNVLSTENSTSGPQNDQFRERAQMGFAFRDSATSSWNWLGMTEFRSERNLNPSALTARRFVVLSSNVNYEPFRSLALSGRYASKFTVDKSLGLDSSAGDQLASLRLTYDLARHWDMGFLGSTMFSNGFSSRQYSAGPELGRLLAKNLWASVGYNLLGYHDTDLSGENQMRRGTYVRLRFKFDEGLLEKMPGSRPK